MLIVPNDLKIKLTYFEDYEYNVAQGVQPGALCLFSDNEKELDHFIQECSQGYITIADLLKRISKNKYIFIGELYSTSHLWGDFDRCIGDWKCGSYKYFYHLLDKAIAEAFDIKEDVHE